MSDEIACTFTDVGVCPYCGHRHEDSWEWFREGQEEAEIECDKCGKSFQCEVEYSVAYTSRKI